MALGAGGRRCVAARASGRRLRRRLWRASGSPMPRAAAYNRHAQEVFLEAFFLHGLCVPRAVNHNDVVARPDLTRIPMALTIPCLYGTARPDAFHKEPLLVGLTHDIEAKRNVVRAPKRQRKRGCRCVCGRLLR